MPLAAAILYLRHDKDQLEEMRRKHAMISVGMSLDEVRERLPEGVYQYKWNNQNCDIYSPTALGGTYFVVFVEAGVVTGKREGS